MKKVFFTLPLLAAALWSCSSDEPDDQGNNGNVAGETQYLAISITTASESAPVSRGDEPADAKYEDGEADESQVKSLDFYFFHADDTPANVKGGTSNHLSVNDKDIVEGAGTSPNVTKTIKAVLVINTQDGDLVPSKILAVVNDKTDYSGKSVSELQGLLSADKTENGFVMTNSVFVSGGNEEIATSVAGHLFNDQDLAKTNPVTIYVERTVAKVRLTTDESLAGTAVDDGIIFPAKNKKGETEKLGDTDLYIKFRGWNVTATSTHNRLVKMINSSWNPGAWIWNTADYHRSFWAINHPDNSFQFGSYNGTATDEDDFTWTPALTKNKFDGSEWVYIKENAAFGEDGMHDITLTENAHKTTQVIIAAQLVDQNGNAVQFAEWAGQRMTLNDLKVAFADAAALYTETQTTEGETTTTTRTKVKPEQLELVTAMEAGYATKDDGKRYLVYAKLTEDAAKLTWYASSSETDNTPLDDAAIKAAFKGLGGAKVWKDGMTYYYFDIKHLATENDTFGQYGVVRNHVYAANIKSLTGLGTPVYNPDEVIYTEHVEDDDTFIAAEIKVLSWRVVGFDVDLNW